MSEQILILTVVSALLLAIILVKVNVLPKKHFQIIFNLIFFAYVYLCFQYRYMDILNKGMMVYGTIGLYYWFKEWRTKKSK